VALMAANRSREAERDSNVFALRALASCSELLCIEPLAEVRL